MAERATKDVLLRLRRTRELELRRELVVTRALRAEARRSASALEATRRKLERSLAENRERRGAVLGQPIAAGRLASADRFERSMKDAILAARVDERRAVARLDAAEAELAGAQRALADAVHARQRSESLAATEKARALRIDERRAEIELEDRYRAPGRGGAALRRAGTRGVTRRPPRTRF